MPSVTIAPARSTFLHILGAPVFQDQQDRGWCLKKCPHCSSIYHWKSDYDYLINGASETSETLTRLTPEGAAPWLASVEQRLAEESKGH